MKKKFLPVLAALLMLLFAAAGHAAEEVYMMGGAIRSTAAALQPSQTCILDRNHWYYFEAPASSNAYLRFYQTSTDSYTYELRNSADEILVSGVTPAEEDHLLTIEVAGGERYYLVCRSKLGGNSVPVVSLCFDGVHAPDSRNRIAVQPSCTVNGKAEQRCLACNKLLNVHILRACIHCGDVQTEPIEKLPRFLGIF